jgi:hypothetical protein
MAPGPAPRHSDGITSYSRTEKSAHSGFLEGTKREPPTIADRLTLPWKVPAARHLLWDAIAKQDSYVSVTGDEDSQ